MLTRKYLNTFKQDNRQNSRSKRWKERSRRRRREKSRGSGSFKKKLPIDKLILMRYEQKGPLRKEKDKQGKEKSSKWKRDSAFLLTWKLLVRSNSMTERSSSQNKLPLREKNS